MIRMQRAVFILGKRHGDFAALVTLCVHCGEPIPTEAVQLRQQLRG
jgi:hypothetical protein